ncbi:hypothetical protein BJV82DRAFT_633214 [Fennellomyces sp. T-0311]|nr:hypothetical protein BJV82DRAFT_633214 [Fennellomyces sp. T-0311]
MTMTTTSEKDQLQSLPTEILYSILDHLTFRERLLCSTLCMSWRMLILNWPGMWKSLSTDDGHNIVPDLLPYDKYIQGSAVQYFRYSSRDFGFAQLSDAMDFVVERECNNIKEARFWLRTMDSSSFLKLSSICGNSLTRVILDLTYGYSLNTITPDQVLLSCPNLRKLYFSMLRSGTWRLTLSSTDFQHQNLIDLALCAMNTEGTFDPLPYLILAPKLQRLSLQYNDISQNVASLPSFLRKHCPALASLRIKESAHGGIWEAKDQDWETQSTSGLKEFVLREPDECEPAVNLCRQIIAESHESLELLELQHGNIFAEEHYASISRYAFPSLKHLHITGILFFEQPEPLYNFFEHSVPKSLTSLKLWVQVGLGGEALLQTIASRLKCLECLDFLEFAVGVSADDFTNFFDLLSGKSLRKIALDCLHELNDRTLISIATRYPALDELRIYNCGGVSMQGVETFLKQWQSDRRMLSKLDLGLLYRDNIKRLSDPNIIMQLLASVDKVAKQWTFKTEFPQMWDGFQFNYRYGTIDHALFRKHRHLYPAYN